MPTIQVKFNPGELTNSNGGFVPLYDIETGTKQVGALAKNATGNLTLVGCSGNQIGCSWNGINFCETGGCTYPTSISLTQSVNPADPLSQATATITSQDPTNNIKSVIFYGTGDSNWTGIQILV